MQERASVTQRTKDKVKQVRRAESQLERPPSKCRGPETSSYIIIYEISCPIWRNHKTRVTTQHSVPVGQSLNCVGYNGDGHGEELEIAWCDSRNGPAG